MAEPKTQKNDGDVEAFISNIADQRKREDSAALVEIMKSVTGEEPAMWGPSIIGFGDHHYKYESGREGDWFRVGFSPRKQNLTLYVMDRIDPDEALLDKLGKHTTGKSCLYIKRLADVDTPTLEKLIERAYKTTG